MTPMHGFASAWLGFRTRSFGSGGSLGDEAARARFCEAVFFPTTMIATIYQTNATAISLHRESQSSRGTEDGKSRTPSFPMRRTVDVNIPPTRLTSPPDLRTPRTRIMESAALLDDITTPDDDAQTASAFAAQWQPTDTTHLGPGNLPIARVQRAWERKPASPLSRRKVRVGKVWKRVVGASRPAADATEASGAMTFGRRTSHAESDESGEEAARGGWRGNGRACVTVGYAGQPGEEDCYQERHGWRADCPGGC